MEGSKGFDIILIEKAGTEVWDDTCPTFTMAKHGTLAQSLRHFSTRFASIAVK